MKSIKSSGSLALVGLFTSFCLSSGTLTGDPSAGQTSRKSDRATAQPASPALSKEVLVEIDALFRDYVGGGVLVIDRGQLVLCRSYGLANVEENEPSAPSTNYRIASMTKQFTAMAIMILVDRGQLSLDATLDHFFPDFPAYGRKITVRRLLNHTAGLPDYVELIPAGTTLQLSDLDALHLLLDTTQPEFEPGSRFQYSNSGYALLALIVEVASGRLFQQFLADEVFRPLKMNQTVLFVRGLNSVPNRAYGYSPGEAGGWVRTDQSLTSAVGGDGCVYTSLDDYAKWLVALDEGRLISAAAYRDMYTPPNETPTIGKAGEDFYGQGTGYGFGWFVTPRHEQPCIWHEGGTVGFTSVVHRHPKRKAAVAVFLNQNQADAPRVCQRIADLTLFGAGHD
jgi:CubicO group peptidase (beta-lactamase class C family)